MTECCITFTFQECCLDFTIDECGIVFELGCVGPPGPSGGVSTFVDLTDTPPSYATQQGKLIKVNATEDGLIFGDPSGTTVSWGDIGGTLADQTDLQNELNAKADAVALTNHTSNLANPHATTAAQVGADPAGSAAVVQTDLNSHKANLANPHSTTAAQVGADTAGSAAAVQTDLDSHKANLANPHSTTAAQVGADPAGSAAGVQTNLDAHEANVANPHATTAAQTGAEPALGNPTLNGQVLSSTTVGVRSWITPPSGGASAFTDLLDTPADYTSQQGKLVKVNATEDGLIFGDPSGATVSWGDIGGTLANQTDLNLALDAKADLTEVTFETLNTNGDVGVGATQVAQGDHLHTGVYDPAGSASAVQLDLDNHKADLANPHATTAVQVGATEEAPLDGELYSRQSAGWTQSPRTPIGGLYGRFTFSDNTAASNPGAGVIRANNADLLLATELYMSATTRFGTAVDPYFLTWGPKDFVGLSDELLGNGAFFNLIGNIVDNTGWFTIPVSPQSGGDSSIANNRDVVLTEITAPDSRVPRGGTVGQAVTKTGANDFQTGWGDFDTSGSAAAVQGNLDTHVADFSVHLTVDQNGALDNANAPSAANPVATIADVSGVTTFTALSDTPADYTSQQGKLVKVNATEDGLIFGDPSGATVSWGDISGTLSNQTDLDLALNAKIGPAGVTYENLAANLDVGTGATQVAQGDHLHTGVYDPAGSAAGVQSNLTNHISDLTLHLTAAQNDALDNANAPGAANPIATINDIPATVPEAPQDSLPKTRVNDGVSPFWQTERVVPDGGTEGQIIAKNSATEQDAGWSDIPTPFSATWAFDSSTVAADPGTGEFRLNAATRATTTALYFNNTTASGIDISQRLNILKVGQEIIVIQADKPDRAAVFEVSSTPVDNTGWFTIPVTHVQNGSGGEFQSGRNVVFDFTGFGGGSIVNWGEIIGTLSDQTDLQTALDAKEDGLGNPAADGYVLSSTVAGVRSWIAQTGGSSESVTLPVKVQVARLVQAGAGVRVSGWDATAGKPLVEAADIASASAMPVIGFALTTETAGTEFDLPIYGSFDFDTSAYALNDRLYQGNLGTMLTAPPNVDGQENQEVARVTVAGVSGKIFVNPDSGGYYQSPGGIAEAPDVAFGYVREGSPNNVWVRGSRVFEAATEPAGMAIGDMWIET